MSKNARSSTKSTRSTRKNPETVGPFVKPSPLVVQYAGGFSSYTATPAIASAAATVTGLSLYLDANPLLPVAAGGITAAVAGATWLSNAMGKAPFAVARAMTALCSTWGLAGTAVAAVDPVATYGVTGAGVGAAVFGALTYTTFKVLDHADISDEDEFAEGVDAWVFDDKKYNAYAEKMCGPALEKLREAAGWEYRPAPADGPNGSLVLWELPGAMPGEYGWTANLVYPQGCSLEGKEAAVVSAIGRELGLHSDCAVTIEAGDRQNEFRLSVQLRPLPENGFMYPLELLDTVRSINDRLPMFMDQRGTPWGPHLRQRSMYVAGNMGAGKSTLLEAIVLALAACDDVLIFGADLGKEEGSALAQVGGLVDRMATSEEDFIEMLEALKAAAKSRFGSKLNKVSPEQPQIMLLIDEGIEVLVKPRVAELIKEIDRTARSAGIRIVTTVTDATGTSTNADISVKKQAAVLGAMTANDTYGSMIQNTFGGNISGISEKGLARVGSLVANLGEGGAALYRTWNTDNVDWEIEAARLAPRRPKLDDSTRVAMGGWYERSAAGVRRSTVVVGNFPQASSPAPITVPAPADFSDDPELEAAFAGLNDLG